MDPAQRARLLWRCRRGMLELDLLLQGFVDSGYGELDAAGRAAFERLLALPDQRIHNYLFGTETPRDGELGELLERIRRAYTP